MDQIKDPWIRSALQVVTHLPSDDGGVGQALAIAAQLCAVGCDPGAVRRAANLALGERLWRDSLTDQVRQYILACYVANPALRSAPDDELLRAWRSTFSAEQLALYWTDAEIGARFAKERGNVHYLVASVSKMK